MNGQMGGEVPEVRRKYIVGPCRHCEDVWLLCGVRGEGSMGFREEEQSNLTCLLYSITLAVKLKVDPKKARAIIII